MMERLGAATEGILPCVDLEEKWKSLKCISLFLRPNNMNIS